MFDLFNSMPEPANPLEVRMSVVIDRPASEVYGLVDWGDLRNLHTQMGDRVTANGSPDRFRLIMTEMPEHKFDMVVSEAEPATVYAYSTTIEPKVGRLVKSQESYAIEAQGDNQCELTLTIIAQLDDDLEEDELEDEVMMVTVACHNTLQKLKILAEEGVEAVKAVNDRMIV